MKVFVTCIAVLVIVFSSVAHAAIINNGIYTTDTNLGLDYLDVGLVFGDYTAFQAGVTYGGRTWVLASADQLASTWSDATGLTLTTANILSSDNDMTFAATDTLINLFDGVTTDTGAAGERVIGNYGANSPGNVLQYGDFIVNGKVAVHDVFNDSHFYGDTDNFRSAWLVSATGVPEPGTLALLALGLFGMGAARKMRK